MKLDMATAPGPATDVRPGAAGVAEDAPSGRWPAVTTCGELVGASPAQQAAFAVARRVARSTATVLVTGETGTGKTALARAIHDHSPRRCGPFLVVDVAAIPPTLLESELFGHERGAFTGADQRRLGAFEAAAGGTIFLDEIGELSQELQPKLLRALENREVRRVGGRDTVALDVRVVAATHRDLPAEVAAGRFRADLYYRLAVIGITQPPLRERPEDVVVIARHLLGQLRASAELTTRLTTGAAGAALARAPWLGNVRELRNHLERCVVFGEALPIAVATPAPAPVAAPDDDRYLQARQRALHAFERAYLDQLLRRHGDRVAEAAAAAGIDRTSLYRMLRRHRGRAA
ncbi:MAG: sigma-54 dependent transcriptional regulator [Kofleriaceae bacterium]